MKNILWLKAVCASSIGKKTMMAASGLLLGIFLLVHLAGNLTLFLGRRAFLAYAEHLHSLGPLLRISEAGLVLLFLLHVITAALVFLENLAARPSRYAMAVSAGRSWPARLMPYSGLVILLFLLLHLGNFHFTDGQGTVADLVRSVLTQPLYAALYMVAMLALGLHLYHGFWSMLQTLGLNHPRYTTLLEKGPVLLGLLIGVFFFLIPLTALLSGTFLQ